MSLCTSIKWKFWAGWDPLGRKRMARLERRIEELEAEVMAPHGGLWATMLRGVMWDYNEVQKPVKLTLRDKVNRLCEHVGVTFEKQDAKYVLKIKKPPTFKRDRSGR